MEMKMVEIKRVTLKEGLWIAKDKDGSVWPYTSKPRVREDYWYNAIKPVEEIDACFYNIPDLGPWDKSLHKVVADGILVPEQVPLNEDMPVEFLGDQHINGELIYALYHLKAEGRQTSFAVRDGEDIQAKAREAYKRFEEHRN